jgi:ubiquinone/menaquinone biosynthesis C-methylase UbiE
MVKNSKANKVTAGQPKQVTGYLHGFTQKEQQRLYYQARFMEQRVHEGLPFHRCKRLLEVGCGVGAQSEILLRRFPALHVTGIDAAKPNLLRAKAHLKRLPWASGRYELQVADASQLGFEIDSFDAAFLCWVLEHVADPMRVLSEVRRVLRPGSPVVVTEVQNMTFFIDPYSPQTMTYWLAFNDHQLELGGDPFVGAKLGNLLQAVGFRDVVTEVRSIFLDNRAPGERGEMLEFWSDLLLSGAQGLLRAGKVSADTVDGMRTELEQVAHDPNAVFFYSFIQARARVH